MVVPIVDDGGTPLLRPSNRRNPGQLKLLIVDDDGASRAVLRSLLKQHLSALVSEAEDGAQALDMIERGAPDAVFLDLVMPVMDGLEVLEMLRRDPVYRSLPVVVLSALSDRATVQRAISLGIADYLVKPLRPLIVDTRILALLTAIERRQRSGRPHPSVRPTRGSEGGRRLLLVDNDVNFGAFFIGLFEEEFEIVQAENGRQAIRTLADWTPELVCIGAGLRLPTSTELARKIRASHGKSVGVYLCSGMTTLTDEEAAVFDGLLPKTFVPAAFRKEFARVVSAPPDQQRPEDGLLTTQLRDDIITATRQTLGVTTMQEVHALSPDDVRSIDVEVWASIELHGTPDLPWAKVALAGSRAHIEQLAERMIGAPMTLEEGAGDALGELVNTVGGRVLAGLEARGLMLKVGLPIVSTNTAPGELERYKMVVPFETDGGERVIVAVGIMEPLGSSSPAASDQPAGAVA